MECDQYEYCAENEDNKDDYTTTRLAKRDMQTSCSERMIKKPKLLDL